MIKRAGNVAYWLKLPERMKVHSTFHVSFFKPYYEDTVNERQLIKRALPSVRRHYEKAIVKILDHRRECASRKNRWSYYLVQWEGENVKDATWEKDVDLWQFEDKIQRYLETLSTRTSESSGGSGFVRP